MNFDTWGKKICKEAAILRTLQKAYNLFYSKSEFAKKINYKGTKMDLELFKAIAQNRLTQLEEQVRMLTDAGWEITGFEIESKVNVTEKDSQQTCTLTSSTEMEQ